METKPFNPDEITGHLIKLSEDRLVFLGECPEEPDAFFIGFRNPEGKETKFSLSKEAKEALTELLTEDFKGERVAWPFTATLTYEVFVKSNDNEEEPNGST